MQSGGRSQLGKTRSRRTCSHLNDVSVPFLLPGRRTIDQLKFDIYPIHPHLDTPRANDSAESIRIAFDPPPRGSSERDSAGLSDPICPSQLPLRRCLQRGQIGILINGYTRTSCRSLLEKEGNKSPSRDQETASSRRAPLPIVAESERCF